MGKIKLVKKIKEFINNTKIRTKLIAVYLMGIIFTVSIVGVYLTTKINSILVEKSTYGQSVNCDTAEYRIREILSLAVNLSDMIYSDVKLHNMISTEYRSYSDVVDAYRDYPILENYLKYYKEIASIRFYVNNDTLLNSSQIMKVTKDVQACDWYRNAITNNGVITWKYKSDEITKEEYLSLIRCIKDKSGKQIGVLVINMQNSELEKVLADIPSTAAVALDTEIVASNREEENEGLEKYIINSQGDISEQANINNQLNEVILRSFKINKSFKNKFKVIITEPLSAITKQTNRVILYSLFAIVAATILSVMFIVLCTDEFSKRVEILRSAMHKIVGGDFVITDSIEGKDEVGQLYADLIIMINSIKKLINEVYVEKIQKEQLKAKQNEIEFKMLASQINPHFLYNTLETIRMKAFCNGDREIADIVKKLGKIMRRNLEVSDKIVSLKSELDLVANYLEIQALRFEGRVSYEFNTELDTEKYKVLPLLLQPIVENAFVHGLEGSKEGGKIIVNIYLEAEYLIVEVKDNGVGINKEKLVILNKDIDLEAESGRRSLGVRNIKERIQLYYGEEYNMKIESTVGKGTTVKLYLPMVWEEE